MDILNRAVLSKELLYTELHAAYQYTMSLAAAISSATASFETSVKVLEVAQSYKNIPMV